MDKLTLGEFDELCDLLRKTHINGSVIVEVDGVRKEIHKVDDEIVVDRLEGGEDQSAKGEEHGKESS